MTADVQDVDRAEMIPPAEIAELVATVLSLPNNAAIAELLVSVYGGYFGAGIGFMTLAMLAMMGMRDIHAMGAIRTLLAVAINAAAVVTFIVAKAVLWPQCAVMILGSLVGGWFGAHYAQKADPRKVRGVVIGVGIAMSAYFFFTVP